MSGQHGFVATDSLPPFPFDEVLTFREGPIILSDEGLRRAKEIIGSPRGLTTRGFPFQRPSLPPEETTE